MTTITATHFQRSFGEVLDKCLTEPVTITQRGREKAVLLSPTVYKQLLERGGVRVISRKTNELPPELFKTLTKPLTHKQYLAGGKQKISTED